MPKRNDYKEKVLASMRFLRALTSHPVEVLAGLALIGVGIVLTNVGSSTASKSTFDVILGAVATAFGGVLLSWTVGKEVSRGDALKEIRSQLDLVSRNLGQASGQISRAVEQAQSQDLQPATGFALVSQAATMIYGQVSAIQTILGDRFDAEDLLFTVTELESLAVRLEKKTTGSDKEVDAVRSRLQEMRTQLARSTVTKAKSSETVSCPYCDSTVVVSIGLNGGDTASTVCSNCRRRFNAHRRADGSLFQRPDLRYAAVGRSSNNSMAFEGSCPKCGKDLRIQPVKIPSTGIIEAVCVECASRVKFNVESRQLTALGQMEKAIGKVVGHNSASPSGRPIIQCPICSRKLVCVIRKESAYYAADTLCNVLYKVDREEFNRWREAENGQGDNSSLSLESSNEASGPPTLHFGSGSNS